MKLKTLHELYVDELEDLYNSEPQILKALPDTIQAMSATEFADAFEEYRKLTELAENVIHVEAMEGV